MTNKTWKVFERRIAKRFNTFRTPLSGGDSRHTTSDSLHDKLYIEAKYRKKVPFMKTFNLTCMQALKEGKIPLVIFLEKSNHNPIIMCSINNLKEIAGFLDVEGMPSENNANLLNQNDSLKGSGEEIK